LKGDGNGRDKISSGTAAIFRYSAEAADGIALIK
jgi:hypothetical protein